MQIADEVGISRSRVAEVLSEKSQNCEKADTQGERAKSNGVSHYTQRKIDRIRNIDPDLADDCENKKPRLSAV